MIAALALPISGRRLVSLKRSVHAKQTVLGSNAATMVAVAYAVDVRQGSSATTVCAPSIAHPIAMANSVAMTVAVDSAAAVQMA